MLIDVQLLKDCYQYVRDPSVCQVAVVIFNSTDVYDSLSVFI